MDCSQVNKISEVAMLPNAQMVSVSAHHPLIQDNAFGADEALPLFILIIISILVNMVQFAGDVTWGL